MVKIAVTGGTGFVGGHIIEQALNRGWEVHSFGRRPVQGTFHHQWNMETPNEKSTESFDAVIHVAAMTDDCVSASNSNAILNANVNGTKRALEIDSKARFIYISSASVYHGLQPRARWSFEKDFTPEGFLNVYSETKYLGEQAVELDPREAGTVILRPHAVYGKNDKTLIPRVEESVRGNTLILPSGGKTLISLTNVETLADAALFFATVENPQYSIYNVADGQPVGLGIALQEVLAIRGKNVKIKSLNHRLAWKIGELLETKFNFESKIKKRRISHPMLTRYMVSQLGYTHVVDVSRLEKEMGKLMPPTDVSHASEW